MTFAFLPIAGLVAQARAYIGRTGPSLGLPSRLWCSDFANLITGGGSRKQWFRGQITGTAALAITIEPQGGSPQPTGTVTAAELK